MSSPIELSNGRDTVKIYTSSARGKPLFQVAFYRAGRRERRSFANRGEAKREAKLILTQLGSTASDAEKAVTTPEVESLVAARNALEGIDCPVHIAVEGFAKAVKALGSPSSPVASLLEAVAFYRKHNPENAERIPLKDLTEQFVKSRRSRGLSDGWADNRPCKPLTPSRPRHPLSPLRFGLSLVHTKIDQGGLGCLFPEFLPAGILSRYAARGAAQAREVRWRPAYG